jgi:hypothetical protein
MDLCRRLVLAGSRLLKPGPLPVSTNANGITSIEPPSACVDAQIAIVGSFAPTQPPNVTVLLDSTPLTVVSWSSTRIIVIVPANAKAGCIGFRNETTEAAIKNALQDRAEGFAQVSEGLACLGLPPIEAPVLTVAPSRAPCNGLNLFLGTVPEIDAFLANGDVQVDVEPGAPILLSWAVRNATQVRIRQLGTVGPPAVIDAPVPAAATPTAVNGSSNIGPWNGTTPLDENYQLTAVNACGQATAQVTVRLRRRPALKIRGMELIQAIQRPDPLVTPTPATVGGPVRLAARRRTVLRVYTESGLTGGFVYGGQPNELQITGSVDLAVSVGVGQTGINPIGGLSFAKPSASRTDLQTLEFELPWDRLNGGVHLTVSVRPANPAWGSGVGYEVKSTMSAQFQPRTHLTLVRLRVFDAKRNLQAPSIATWQASMVGSKDRYPVAEDQYIEAIAPGFDVITTTRNLDDKADWEELIDDVDDIADGFTDFGQIWVALTPRRSAYSLNGIAHAFSDNSWPATDQHRVMVVQRGKPASYAHEMSHTLGVGHANCGAIEKDSADSRLPGGGTEAGTLGRRMSTATLFGPGWSELMSYCTPSAGTPAPGNYQDRWPSVALWDILFDLLH